MAFSLHEQYIDSASGFHVIVLRDGKKEHLVQIALAADSCPACGAVHPKDNLGTIDPRAAVASVLEELNRSQSDITAYATKHGVQIK